jgi:hypothetical protein
MVGKKKRKAPPQMPNTKSKFEILSDGQHAHTVETPYGKIVYTYSPKILSGILAGIFTTLLGRAYYNRPLDFQKLLERPEDEPPYEYLFTKEPELLAEKEQHSKYAAELLWNQASRLLIEASEQLIQEVIFRTLREFQNQGKYKLNSGISELLKLLTSDIIERVKIRVNAPTQGGSKAKWTPERKEAFLVTYEKAYEALKRAKKIYGQNKELDNWRGMVSAVYPQLPEQIINLLPVKGKGSEPKVLALEYAAELFKVKYTEYLSDVVKDARRLRREERGIKKEI